MSNLRLRLFWDATLAVDRAMTWSLKIAEWTVLARSNLTQMPGIGIKTLVEMLSAASS